MTATGIQPLTEAELAQRGPGAIRAAAIHAIDVLQWMSRTSPATSIFLPLSVRRCILRLGGCKIGRKVTGLKKCVIETNQITIGDGSFINACCWFEGKGTIDIGSDAFLGPQVMLVTSVHEIAESGQVMRVPVYRQVRIGNRCWVGARAMVMPGVTIGEGTIIGAGAVVTRDCEPGAVYVGVPARRVR